MVIYMITDLFKGLDIPDQRKYNLDIIDSIESQKTLDDILKYLSIYIKNNRISPTNATLIYNSVMARKNQLQEELKIKRSNGGKRMKFTPTSVSNRVGSANLVFLITNIAITTVMYTLLILSHFLNN